MRILCFAGYANSGEKDAQYIGEGTAIVLFPLGSPAGGAPARWLLFVSAAERQTDQEVSHLQPWGGIPAHHGER